MDPEVPAGPTPVSPADEWRANPLSRLTWGWLTPLVKLGGKKQLDFEDAGSLRPEDRSGRMARIIGAQLAATDASKPMTKRLVSVLLRQEPFLMLTAGVWKGLGDLLGFVAPLALTGIVKFCGLKAAGLPDERMSGMEMGYWWLLAIIASSFLQNLALQHHHQQTIRTGARVKHGISLLVFEKALRLDPAARAAIGDGLIQNLQSVDANAISMTYWFIHYLWASPLVVALSVALLYSYLGPACFVGLGVLVSLVPAQGLLAKAAAAALKSTMQSSDKRIRLLGETISGIRIVKLFGMEGDFEARITGVRAEELVTKRRAALVASWNSWLLNAGPLAVALLSFLCYAYTSDQPLTASKAFGSMTVFGLLRLPLTVLPMVLNALISGRVAVRRVAAFLALPECVDSRTLETVAPGSDAPAVELRSATLTWTPSAADAAAIAAAKKMAGIGGDKDGKGKKAAKAGSKDKASGATASSGADAAPATASSTAQEFLLKDITLALPAGKLTTIVGRVGAGKSSLLQCVLGAMRKTGGEVIVRLPPAAAPPTKAGEAAVAVGGAQAGAAIAYCSQAPWIMNATLKNNILFGRPLDESRYQAVLDACALRPDLAILPGGDATEIGERGVNLSGGQKARISLARAVYSEAPLVLLDDVLSAVDAHVGRHIFSQCLRGPLMAGRTILFASHQLQYLSQTDFLVVLHSGGVAHAGTFEEVRASEGAELPDPDTPGVTVRRNLLTEMLAQRQAIEEELAATSATSAASAAGSDSPMAATPAPAAKAVEAPAPAPAAAAPTKATEAAPAKPVTAAPETKGKLMTTEGRAKGAVGSNTYVNYFTSFGAFNLISMLITLVLTAGIGVMVDVWLGWWSSNRFPGLSVGQYLGVYAGITGLTSVVIMLNQLTWAFGATNASTVLHKSMLKRVLRAPMSFYDTTPAGRIINRFSSDFDSVDRNLPTSANGALGLVVKILATLVLQAVLLPWTLLGTVPTAALYYWLQRMYRKASTELKRLTAVSMSPVYAHLSETLSGIDSIRAYGVGDRFRATSEARIDRNGSVFIKSNLLNRWLGLRLDWLGALLTSIVALVAVLTAGPGQVSPSLIGLALQYVFSISGLLNWCLRSLAETEQHAASVERVVEYSRIPIEAAPITDVALPQAWPSAGAVDFTGVTVRYRPELDPVLRDVTVSIAAGEKVGICGRTGSGKSTMLLCLFRILEVEEGRITIDGVDTKTLGLDTLRQRLAIIPQDPVLFNGTVRRNLDISGAASDAALWDAVDRVQLRTIISDLGGLDAIVEEGGRNLSAGSRQLLCMARALIRRAKVLVLDEATASTDVTTDAAIQRMLREDPEFKGVTQLTIAHRVNTIIDSDKVLVLEQGRVAEFGSPAELLANPASHFAGLVRESAKTHDE